MSFIFDNGSVPGVKADSGTARPASPNRLNAAELNQIRQALLDTQSAFSGARWLDHQGASLPAPAGAGKSRIAADAGGRLWASEGGGAYGLVKRPARGPHTVFATDFGVKADGVTDDAPALQAIVDAIPYGTPMRIVVPGGNMLLNSPLLIDRPYIDVVGEGRYSANFSATGFVGPAVICMDTGSGGSGAGGGGSAWSFGSSLLPGAGRSLTVNAIQVGGLVLGQAGRFADWHTYTQFNFVAAFKPDVLRTGCMLSVSRPPLTDATRGQNQGVQLYTVSDGSLSFHVFSTAGHFQCSTAAGVLSPGVTAVIHFEWDGASVRIFVNGVMRAKAAGVGGTLVFGDMADPLLFCGICDSWPGLNNVITDAPTGAYDMVTLGNTAWKGADASYTPPSAKWTLSQIPAGTTHFFDFADVRCRGHVLNSQIGGTILHAWNMGGTIAQMSGPHFEGFQTSSFGIGILMQGTPSWWMRDVEQTGGTIGLYAVNNCYEGAMLQCAAIGQSLFGWGFKDQSGLWEIFNARIRSGRFGIVLAGTAGGKLHSPYIGDFTTSALYIDTASDQISSLVITGGSPTDEGHPGIPGPYIAVRSCHNLVLNQFTMAKQLTGADPLIKAYDSLTRLTAIGCSFGDNAGTSVIDYTVAPQALPTYIECNQVSEVNVAPRIKWTTINGADSASVFVGSSGGGLSVGTEVRLNRTGTVTISDTATSAAVTFGTSEFDATYSVRLSEAGFSGAPAAGMVQPASIAIGGFSVQRSAAPGVGTSVTYRWEVIA